MSYSKKTIKSTKNLIFSKMICSQGFPDNGKDTTKFKRFTHVLEMKEWVIPYSNIIVQRGNEIKHLHCTIF